MCGRNILPPRFHLPHAVRQLVSITRPLWVTPFLPALFAHPEVGRSKLRSAVAARARIRAPLAATVARSASLAISKTRVGQRHVPNVFRRAFALWAPRWSCPQIVRLAHTVTCRTPQACLSASTASLASFVQAAPRHPRDACQDAVSIAGHLEPSPVEPSDQLTRLGYASLRDSVLFDSCCRQMPTRVAWLSVGRVNPANITTRCLA